MFTIRIASIAKLSSVALLAVGCSKDSTNGQTNATTGGASATGGTTADAGATGTAGDSSVAGSSATGGAGTSIGGTTSNGGTTSSGGASATGGSSAQCSSGAKQCSLAGVPQTCSSSGTWQDGTACTGLNYCKAGSCVACGGTAGPAMVALAEGGYCIDSTEVTRSQYLAWLNTNPPTTNQSSNCAWNTSFTPGENVWPPTDNLDFPVRAVDWCDAYAYCQAAGKRLCGKIGGGTNAYADFASSALDQWFSACSSHGTFFNYLYATLYSKTACNGMDYGTGDAVAVGSISTCQSSVAGYTGIFDMSGNASEWEDCCDETSATTPGGVRCKVRGGSYFSASNSLACNSDTFASRSYAALDVGFRCCSI